MLNLRPGSKAKTKTIRQTVFRFFFNKVENASFNPEHANWYEMVMNDIQSPNEFQLIKMQVKENKKGGRRLFPSSMSYTVAGFSGTNASNREMVNFEIKTYGSFCRIECAPIPYKHRHSERFKVLSCKIELFNSSIGHFAG